MNCRTLIQPYPIMPLPADLVHEWRLHQKQMLEVASVRAGSPPIAEGNRLTDADRAELAEEYVDSGEDE